MRSDVPCNLPAGYDGSIILERLDQVLDPELDESILDLCFVRSVELHAGHADIALRLPTSWCAVNFAYLMAEDVRHALLGVEDIREVTVRLGDHCAAAEIEAAVNAGGSFADAFPGEDAGSLAALRVIFLRKGFLIRQQRLLRELREAGLTAAAICALQLAEVSMRDDVIVLGASGPAPFSSGSGTILQRYLQRRAELGFDCSPAAALIIDLDGRPFAPERLQQHYEAARTMRIALEANGSFCRALMARASGDDAEKAANAKTGERHVPA
jgi:metal-sulfur cluster biosynthetic enzyme